MKNTLSQPTKKRTRISNVALVFAFLAMFCVAICILLMQKQSKDFNGQVVSAQGIVSSVDHIDGSLIITLDTNDSYNVNLLSNDYDWESLKGQKVSLIVSKESTAQTFVLGLYVEGEMQIDFNKTLERERAENSLGAIISGIVAGLTACIACGFLVWKTRIPKYTETDIGELFANLKSNRQPSNVKIGSVLLSYLILIVIAAIPFVGVALILAYQEQIQLFFVFILLAVTCVLFILALYCIKKYINKINIKFYKENYPFDIADLRYILMKPSTKKAIQEHIKQWLLENPHCYSDALDNKVKFTAEGVELLDSNDYSPINTDRTNKNSVELWQCDSAKVIGKFTYQQLNFEAQAFWVSEHCPLVVIIRSRLPEDGTYPEFMTSDLFFSLSKNLLETLETFNVPVENLHKILDNKEAYMKEYSFRKKRKG